MPWCGSCERYHAPSALSGGRCPVCGGPVEESSVRSAAERPEATRRPPGTKVPWHFWVLVVAAVGYLGWRLIQGLLALGGLL